MLDMLWATWRFASEGKLVLIDTYSTTNFWYAVWVARICRWRSCDYIPYLHGGRLPDRLRSNPKAAQRLFGKAMVNISPSAYLLQQFKEAGYQNVDLIPNYIDLEDYSFRPRTSIRPRLLWVRSFAEIYNPLMGLMVLEALLKQYPEAELCMVGPDKDGSLARCKDYARERQLPVRFTGKLEKTQWVELSRGYDVFINTTHFDNTPVSVIEAMALGMAVVSTDVGGMPYLLESGKEGLLVPDGDVEAMCSAIVEILEVPEKTLNMVHSARKRVEVYDWKVVKGQWSSLLLE